VILTEPLARKPLTHRQAEIVIWVVKTFLRDWQWPSYREVMSQFKIGSPNGVVAHFRALAKKGWMDRLDGKARRSPILGLKNSRGEGLKLLKQMLKEAKQYLEENQ
jgi:SOS-response transcriptional repressor LexA